MRDLIVRRCEPEDYEAVYRVYSSPNAMAGMIGVPCSSAQEVREELARETDGTFPRWPVRDTRSSGNSRLAST